LPFSRASPLFLVAFLFSLTLQARPCVYCVVLLVALAQSSCYWQAVPAEELASSIGTNHPLKLPSEQVNNDIKPVIEGNIRLIDRCWCEFTTTNFFQPYDVGRWELLSIDHERKLRQKEARVEAVSVASQEGPPSPESMQVTAEVTEASMTPAETVRSLLRSPTLVVSKVGKLWASWLERRSPLQVTATEDVEPSKSSKIDEPTPTPGPPPLLPSQYDLRPHGLGVVVDFGWGRRDS